MTWCDLLKTYKDEITRCDPLKKYEDKIEKNKDEIDRKKIHFNPTSCLSWF